jgi:hypothetical protein
MAYHVYWDDNSQTIARQVYEGSVGRADFEAMVCASSRLLQTVPHSVDIIMEWHGERQMINDISLIYGAMFAEKRVPDNQRYVFMVKAPLLIRGFAQVLQRAAPRATGSLYFLETVEEAYRLRAILLETKISPVS